MAQLEMFIASNGLNRGTDEMRSLMRRAKELYPTSRHLRHEWFKVKMQYDLVPQVSIGKEYDKGIDLTPRELSWQ